MAMSRSPEDPICTATRERLEPYVDEELDAEAARKLSSHLAACAACRAELELTRAIRHELRGLPELDTPAPVLDAIFERTSRSEVDHGLFDRLRQRRRARFRVGLAAAALVLLAVTAAVLRDVDHPAPDTAEVAAATAEARLALQRAGLVTIRAGLEVRDRALRDHLVRPAASSLQRSLRRSPPISPELDGAASDNGQGGHDA